LKRLFVVDLLAVTDTHIVLVAFLEMLSWSLFCICSETDSLHLVTSMDHSFPWNAEFWA